jgi:hypothetical protein
MSNVEDLKAVSSRLSQESEKVSSEGNYQKAYYLELANSAVKSALESISQAENL